MKKIGISIAAILLITLLGACNQQADDDEQEQEEKVIPVETEEATEGDIVIEKTIYGRTAPSASTPVMVQNPGEIDSLEVQNGDQVEENDVIATIQTPAGKQNIRASKAGEIAQLSVSEGGIASTEEPLAIITDLQTIQLNFTVTSDVRGLVEREDKLNVDIDGNQYKAEVSSVGTMPDDTGLYPIEATVNNDEEDLIAGLTAKLHIPEERINSAIIVPTEAIEEANNESFVYVIKDNEAIRTVVTPKETQSDKTAIEGEVKAGDQIVINGQLSLSDGSQVNVVKGE
ncbi:efflux RND transporter periplasmic adaptor subunit [Virgibacillus salexigens]|uniref:efflux RND transporter periplasmic adaptor subunit n=1 Tax=Virgibacillus TaxID=84406 RepID=UPI00136D1992|nr:MULTISPECIES: efflux RND transporter periplasmic adaptor subunit [Virgibacillus]MYL40868.1 efflux RND transporter periplasmic adaptor subunit [Virgibacillus massiliensis]